MQLPRPIVFPSVYASDGSEYGAKRLKSKNDASPAKEIVNCGPFGWWNGKGSCERSRVIAPVPSVMHCTNLLIVTGEGKMASTLARNWLWLHTTAGFDEASC